MKWTRLYLSLGATPNRARHRNERFQRCKSQIKTFAADDAPSDPEAGRKQGDWSFTNRLNSRATFRHGDQVKDETSLFVLVLDAWIG